MYEKLGTENQRDAFRIIRSFQNHALLNNSLDFPVPRDNLARRIGLTVSVTPSASIPLSELS